MYIGMLLVILGAVVCFSADRFFKKGKIKDLKSLLKIKLSGLGITIIGVIVAIYLNK